MSFDQAIHDKPGAAIDFLPGHPNKLVFLL